MDAREVMLAEMARAFNLGLGLGGDGGDTSFPREVEARERAGGESGQLTATGRALPPEDSFERFLMDLQAELRVVLSQPTGNAEEATLHPPLQPLVADSSSITPSVVSTTAPSTSPASTSVSAGNDTSVENHASVENDEVIPALANLTDSEDEEDNEEAEDEGELANPTTDYDMPPLVPDLPSSAFPLPLPTHLPHASSAPENNTAGAGAAPQTTQANSRTEHRRGGGINWWRLYRFPPITSPHAQGTTPALNGMGLAQSHTHVPDATSQGSATRAENMAPTPPSAPSEGRNNTVIPVIVVGLQSVSGVRRREQATGENEDAVGGREADANDGFEDDGESDGMAGSPDGEETQRGRRWHSRAANAIRNFRPGRRGPPGRIVAGEGPGSRTFLIYVIGGECVDGPLF
jgi:hypothetical protein